MISTQAMAPSRRERCKRSLLDEFRHIDRRADRPCLQHHLERSRPDDARLAPQQRPPHGTVVRDDVADLVEADDRCAVRFDDFGRRLEIEYAAHFQFPPHAFACVRRPTETMRAQSNGEQVRDTAYGIFGDQRGHIQFCKSFAAFVCSNLPLGCRAQPVFGTFFSGSALAAPNSTANRQAAAPHPVASRVPGARTRHHLIDLRLQRPGPAAPVAFHCAGAAFASHFSSSLNLSSEKTRPGLSEALTIRAGHADAQRFTSVQIDTANANNPNSAAPIASVNFNSENISYLSVCSVEGVSCRCANQNRFRRHDQFESGAGSCTAVHERAPLISVRFANSFGRRKQPTNWLSGSRSQRAPRNIFSLARASRRRMPARYCSLRFSSERDSGIPQRGVWYGSQGPQRIVIGRSLAVLSTRLASFSVGWSSPVARQPHKLEVVSSNLTPATKSKARRQAAKATDFESVTRGFESRRARHSWAAPVRMQFKTERTCRKCDVTRVTRHEPGQLPWIEFYRGLDKIEGSGTPKCEGMQCR